MWRKGSFVVEINGETLCSLSRSLCMARYVRNHHRVCRHIIYMSMDSMFAAEVALTGPKAISARRTA